MKLIDAESLSAQTVGITDAYGNFYGAADVVFLEDIKNAKEIGWINTKSILPENGQQCLINIPNCGVLLARYNADEYTFELGGVNMVYVTKVNYWIPIFAVPNDDCEV